MKAAVTGGTGFLGRALLAQLVPHADAVRVLVRRPQDDPTIRALGAEPVRGDLTVPNGCDVLVRPGDVVFHAAARVDSTGTWADFRRTTVEGTRRLLDHALAAGPSRFVYVSSAAVYTGAAPGTTACADRTSARPPGYNYYARAKIEAEKLVRARCDRAGCPWTILRLGFLYGPANRALTEVYSRLARRNRLFLIGRGDNRIATLYVDDAACAVRLTGTHPRAAGRIYDVAGDDHVTQRQFVEATAHALGLPPPRRRVPAGMAHAGAVMASMIGRMIGFEPPFSRAMRAIMSADQLVDASPIREELGWRPEVPFAEGIRRTHEWHLANPSHAARAGLADPSGVMMRRSA